MLNFDLLNRTKIVFGKDAEAKLGDYAVKYGKKALLHYGGGSIIKSGLYDRVKQSLTEKGIEIVELGGVRPNPIVELCYEGIEICKTQNIDMIIAVGGGSVIDSAKCIAFGAKYDGDVWDLCSGKVEAEDNKLPLLTVITMAGSGTEVSPGAVISRDADKLKRGFGNNYVRPDVSFVNPELTYTLPPYQVAAGGVDVAVHCLERVLSSKMESEITENWALATAKAALKYTKLSLENPTDYDTRAQLSYASMYAMMGWLHAGIVTDGVLHPVEHELSAKYNMTHGAGLAILLPAYLKYTAKPCEGRVAKILHELMDVPYDMANLQNTINEGIFRLENYLKSIGMPIRLRECGIDDKDFKYLAHKTVFDRGGTTGHMYPLDEEKIVELLYVAL